MLALIFLPGVAALRQSASIYEEVRAIQDAHEAAQARLERVEQRILQTSLTVRDFLLDNSPITANQYKQRFEQLRQAIGEDLNLLKADAPPDQRTLIAELERQLSVYWDSMVPVFLYTPAQRVTKGTYFLREQQRPRRDVLLTIADNVAELTRRNYRRRIQDLRTSQQHYRRQLEWAVGVSFLMGLAVAIATSVRIALLERAAHQERLAAEQAEAQMRALSVRLMNAQEEERKMISRELHDEVGQTLTALRMELGSLERLRQEPGPAFQQQLEEAKETASQTLRNVRDLAMGLRPSVLDLGVEAALQWQARHFSRRSGTEATVKVEGDLPPLPDAHLTCIYRIVQEALTNCARHARASIVNIHISGSPQFLELRVSDNGVGLPVDWRRRRSMGIIGMEERAREAGGHLEIQSFPGQGTLLRLRLPLREAPLEESRT
ncbi:MAG: sensor histidine kinase [Bryobacterales bacterium]|nr:sensor histidine kinase [Bryobacterales bacterium]